MKKLTILMVLFALIVSSEDLLSEKPTKDCILRKAEKVFDSQKNTLSNFEFMTTNFGVFGIDLYNGKGAGIWPRGSQNMYMFGSGIWIAAKKKRPDNSETGKFVEMTYNVNNGRSWFVPGMVEDGDTVRNDLKDKYRTYFSTDMNDYTGQPLYPDDGPAWPLWIDDSTLRYQYGTYRHTYIHDEDERSRNNHPIGPMFVSDEDIVCIFKDTDLNFFDGGYEKMQSLGYPLGLQIESRLYSWQKEDMKDIVIISYLVENTSNDTLTDCWVAGVYDLDLTFLPNGPAGAANDHVKFFDDDEVLNLAVAWTDTDQGEAGKGFGYIGISMLETPAVDNDGFIRNDQYIFTPEEQIGLRTFNNWAIENDPYPDEVRYDFISRNVRDGDNGPGDKRMLLGTGPFNMKPGDIARVVFAINFALPAKGGEADGTLEDIAGFYNSNEKKDGDIILEDNRSLVGQLITTRKKYYNQIPMSVNDDMDNNNFSLQVYPNPIEGNLINISYRMNEAGNIRLSLLDQLGREVSLLEEGNKTAGKINEQYTIDRQGLGSGVYYLKLQLGKVVLTRKLILMH